MNRLPKSVLAVVIALGTVLVMLAGGFAAFLIAVPIENATPARADGIVVLTGGASRISDALNLLDTGHARRLLITGVNPATSREAISRQVPHHARLFDCCVDIGHEAADTAGNAEEAEAWLRDHHFRSLIVVTSNYHMPRSLAEFARAMPDVEITPYPVVTSHFRADPWWTYPSTLRLLFTEYVKFLAAKTRQVLATSAAHAFGGSSGSPSSSR